jgi:osmoprotectant transport system permease protein
MTRPLAAALLVALTVGCHPSAGTRVGSKDDVESGVLGAMATDLIRAAGTPADHRAHLGGTLVVWEALRAGQIDVYPEFTGTLALQILADPTLADLDKLTARLAADGVGMTKPLGYENNYAVGVTAATADRLGLKAVSDLTKYPDLTLGFSSEFTRRSDGWPGLKAHYGLPQAEPRALEHALAYQALAAGRIDATDVYTTDAEIERYNLRVLADDKKFFPCYAAVLLYRRAWADANPAALAALKKLEGKLDEPAVRRMNARTQAKESESAVAASFLRDSLGVAASDAEESPAARLLRQTGEHLRLVAVSLGAAVLVGIPLGVLSARRPRTGRFVIGFAGLLQTIPSLALLVFMVAVPVWLGGGLGPRPAIIALFLYSLLPIIRNTATGITDISPSLKEAADGLGLTAWQKLRLVELPLASRSILAGVKTAAVINVGTATLGTLVDAGGLGVPIYQGLRANDKELILQGAASAAALALLVEAGFGLLERVVVPRGLRLPSAR